MPSDETIRLSTNLRTGIVKLLRGILFSDVVIATIVILTVSVLSATFWFLLAWLVYEDRYGVNLKEYIQIVF